MNKTTVITREKSVAQTTSGSNNDTLAVGIIGLTSLLIGCWAVVCLVAGTVASGGPGELVANLLTAIS